MDKGQIICSSCSAEFSVPPGLNEAICPRCGRAMPLLKTQLGTGSEHGLPDPAGEEEIWDSVEEDREHAGAEGDGVLGRIALTKMPASPARPPRKTMMGQGAPGPDGLATLASTDGQGQLIPDVIHGDSDAPDLAGDRPLESGFDLGPEEAPAQGVRPMAGLDEVEARQERPSGTMPNLLDELDAELDQAPGLQDQDDEIPEAEPLMEVDEEVSDFFESEQTPGMVLPDDGAIAVSIPEAPVQERMRNDAVSMSSTEPADDGDHRGAGETRGALDGDVSPDLTPVLRSAIFIGLGVGVMLLIGLLYWLIQ